MTRTNRVVGALLALWMSVAVIPAITHADDTVSEDFVETASPGEFVETTVPEDFTEAVSETILPSDTVASDDGVIASGNCGTNLTWTLYEDGTLTISGEGDMYNSYTSPWNAYKDKITNVVLPDGFYLCDKLTSIYFYGDAPSTLDTTFSQTSPDLTLYYISGKSGWTSPTWNGYNTATFVPESKPTVPGDIDGNGTVDYFDVSALYAAYLSEEVDAEIMDINGDGVVDYFDVARLYAAFRGTISLGA